MGSLKVPKKTPPEANENWPFYILEVGRQPHFILTLGKLCQKISKQPNIIYIIISYLTNNNIYIKFGSIYALVS